MAERETALIVGVGPGLGAALARRFADAGMNVGLAARDSARLAPLVDALASSGVVDADVKVVYASYRALIRLGDEAMRPLIHAGLENMDDEKLREEIARGLGESPLAVDREPLLARLDDPDIDVAVLSARALAKLGDESVGPILREKSKKAVEEKLAVEFAKAAAQLGS